jgi:hypothetical protein
MWEGLTKNGAKKIVPRVLTKALGAEEVLPRVPEKGHSGKRPLPQVQGADSRGRYCGKKTKSSPSARGRHSGKNFEKRKSATRTNSPPLTPPGALNSHTRTPRRLCPVLWRQPSPAPTPPAPTCPRPAAHPPAAPRFRFVPPLRNIITRSWVRFGLLHNN